MTLSEYVKAWNENHNRFIFSLNDSSGMNCPTSVEIRYPTVKYKYLYSTDNWHRLNDMVDAKSHGTMFIVSTEYLFERGIIEAKIASCNHNYSEGFVIGVLTWIGEKFFEEEKLQIPGVRRYDE